MNKDILGNFEVWVLTGVVGADGNAYGVTIQENVERLEGQSVSIGAVYTTLGRLEEKGYVKSWYGPPTSARGGRPKRFYEVTAEGKQALRLAQEPMGRVLATLQEAGI